MTHTTAAWSAALALGVGALLVGAGTTPAAPSRTEIIGFSQTGQFFESVAAEPFQARIQSGSNLEKWENPAFRGWNAPVRGAECSRSEVTRVIFTMSAESPIVGDVVSSMDNVRVNISAQYPSEVLWQPVIGGTADAVCLWSDGRPIRATLRHPVAQAAIAEAQVSAAAHLEIARSRYADQTGHLTPEGAASAGAQFDAWAAGTPITTTTTTAVAMPTTTVPPTTTTVPTGGCPWPSIRDLLTAAQQTRNGTQLNALLGEATQLGDASC